MTMNTILQPTHVDVQAIERELSQLWKSAAEPTPGAQPVTRACTLNLIACAPDEHSANQMTNVVIGLTGSHPNRAIQITNAPDEGNAALEVWVQANCQFTAPGAPQVCGEQISIAAHGNATAQVPSLVLSLLLPDLPVVLWWPGRAPFDSPLFQRLHRLVDRVIVDSAGFDHPERDLLRMAEWSLGVRDWSLGEHSPRTAPAAPRQEAPVFSDLSWARLTPWRELTAQFFDSRALLPHLHRLDKVIIEYEHFPQQPPNRIQALLLAGWLAARLGWTPLEGGVSVEGALVRIHLRRPAPTVGRNAMRLVTIELHPAPLVDDALDSLAALRLLALDNVLASFVIERTDDPNCARTSAEVAGMPTITRLARIERLQEAEVLAAELRLLSHDRTFEDALRMAGIFTRELG